MGSLGGRGKIDHTSTAHPEGKTWDGLESQILSRALTKVDIARLLVAASPNSGNFLHASPISFIGFRLLHEAIRGSVAQRLGYRACEPHT